MIKYITGAVPQTLGELVTLRVGLPNNPRGGVGLLFYMIDTGDGARGYRIHVNGEPQSQIVIPPGRFFATLHTRVGHLGRVNTLSFESFDIGSPPGGPLDILNVILYYDL